jgi:hypothetical protein
MKADAKHIQRKQRIRKMIKQIANKTSAEQWKGISIYNNNNTEYKL